MGCPCGAGGERWLQWRYIQSYEIWGLQVKATAEMTYGVILDLLSKRNLFFKQKPNRKLCGSHLQSTVEKSRQNHARPSCGPQEIRDTIQRDYRSSSSQEAKGGRCWNGWVTQRELSYSITQVLLTAPVATTPHPEMTPQGPTDILRGKSDEGRNWARAHPMHGIIEPWS